MLDKSSTDPKFSFDYVLKYKLIMILLTLNLDKRKYFD